VLGQLQRGRGAGFLAALALPRAEARDLLHDCLLHDGRYDGQSESRTRYYAELAQQVGVDFEYLLAGVRRIEALDPDQPRIAPQVTAELARRGDAGAWGWIEAYASWGANWEGLLQHGDTAFNSRLAPLLEARFATDEELDDQLGLYLVASYFPPESNPGSRIARAFERAVAGDAAHKAALRARRPPFGDLREELLAAEQLRRDHGELKQIAALAQPTDLEILSASLHPQRPSRLALAVRALMKLGGPRAESLVAAALAQVGVVRQPARFVLSRAARNLPAAITLPLARAWSRSRSPQQAWMAAEVLELHAELQDVPVLVEMLGAELEDDDFHGSISNLATALAHTGASGWIAGVERAYLALRCAYCREDVARALATLDPARFRSTYAFECLWDSDEGTIEIGVAHVSLDQPGAQSRLEQLAADSDSALERAAGAARARLAVR